MSDKPVLMVHVRKFTMHTLSGHSIGFQGPSKPVPVPPAAVQEALSRGAAPKDEVDMPDLSGEKPDRLERAAAEPQGEERKTLIVEAMKDLVGMNNAADFDSNGVPKANKVSDIVGFRVPAAERGLHSGLR